MLRLSVAEKVAQLRDVKGDTGPLQLALRKRLEVLGDIFEANLFQRLALPTSVSIANGIYSG